jgi:hypothetical protein
VFPALLRMKAFGFVRDPLPEPIHPRHSHPANRSKRNQSGRTIGVRRPSPWRAAPRHASLTLLVHTVQVKPIGAVRLLHGRPFRRSLPWPRKPLHYDLGCVAHKGPWHCGFPS